MFDEKMAAAVETAQKRLMQTTGQGSVLMQLAKDMDELAELADRLDPSRIDFDKGGLEKLKINAYWNRFEEYYPALKELFGRMERSRKILSNSITTVNRFCEEYKTAYDKFRSLSDDVKDEDYYHQAAVCENMSLMLENSVSEHKAAQERLTRLLTLLESSIDMAVLLAKQKSGHDVGMALGRTARTSVSGREYCENFVEMKRWLGNNK